MAVLVRITQGTKEYLEVDLVDALGVITDFSGTSPIFDVTSADGLTSYYTGATAVVSQLNKILCLVDTSAAHPNGLWPADRYKLFVTFTTAPEIPRVGPFDFYVVN